MKLTRKELLLGGAAGAALGAAGIYELVDKLADSPPGHFGEGREPEQHLVDGMRVEKQEGVEVVVPLRHHEVVTARVVAPQDQLLDARAELAAVLAKLDADYPGTPDGLSITVAWGLPYFRTHVRGRRGRAPAVRPPGEQARADRRDPLSERPSRDAARGQRRRVPPPQRQRGAHPGGGDGDRRPHERRARRDEHPQGLRRPDGRRARACRRRWRRPRESRAPT